ncbi:unnamed protein product [Symbiodinium natans]|uniref:Uncharacterized protein n=1 Tax=Symbiodinium natans TaxID=878477 RepID=A0A812UUI5_9DINO|nr:unnamed protein product [Symbiodinium natans]
MAHHASMSSSPVRLRKAALVHGLPSQGDVKRRFKSLTKVMKKAMLVASAAGLRPCQGYGPCRGCRRVPAVIAFIACMSACPSTSSASADAQDETSTAVRKICGISKACFA